MVAPLSAGDEKPLAFREPPRASAQAVSFTLGRCGDVEVAVLDGKGKVVRHLAAGVLGGAKPPPAPLQPGFSQKLTWDGKDDDGAKAVNGPFSFRVRAGTQVVLGKFLGSSPYTGQIVGMPYRAPVNGVVSDDQGRLYILMMSAVGSHGNSGMWPWHLRQFDDQGKYLQTMLPYPPSTKPENAHGFRLLETPDRFTPALYTSLYPVFAVLGNEMVPRLVDGQIVFVHSETRTMSFFALDGSNRIKRVKMWPAEAKLNCPTWLDIQVAFSPDGKFAYYSNVAGTPYDGKEPKQIDPKWPQGRVYRHDLTKEGNVPEPFFDVVLPDFATNKYWMPSAWKRRPPSPASMSMKKETCSFATWSIIRSWNSAPTRSIIAWSGWTKSTSSNRPCPRREERWCDLLFLRAVVVGLLESISAQVRRPGTSYVAKGMASRETTPIPGTNVEYQHETYRSCSSDARHTDFRFFHGAGSSRHPGGASARSIVCDLDGRRRR